MPVLLAQLQQIRQVLVVRQVLQEQVVVAVLMPLQLVAEEVALKHLPLAPVQQASFRRVSSGQVPAQQVWVLVQMQLSARALGPALWLWQVLVLLFLNPAY